MGHDEREQNSDDHAESVLSKAVRPDEKNSAEVTIGTGIYSALLGRTFTSDVESMQAAMQALDRGELARTRPEFRKNLLDVIVPGLEAARFSASGMRVYSAKPMPFAETIVRMHLQSDPQEGMHRDHESEVRMNEGRNNAPLRLAQAIQSALLAMGK